uniref:Uncharacterized protein n=1 Tax=Chenopodium quinoa TaxID=63459 RepID=A0A803MRX4_CHEQI
MCLSLFSFRPCSAVTQDYSEGLYGFDDCCRKRFLELSETLMSGTTPKFDKAAILTDAIRQAKKKALCAEKHRLVSEKEKLEQRINFVGSCPSLHFHPTSVPTSYVIPCQAVGGKLMPLLIVQIN